MIFPLDTYIHLTQSQKPMTTKTAQDYINEINIQRQKPLEEQTNDLINAVAIFLVALDNYIREV